MSVFDRALASITPHGAQHGHTPGEKRAFEQRNRDLKMAEAKAEKDNIASLLEASIVLGAPFKDRSEEAPITHHPKTRF